MSRIERVKKFLQDNYEDIGRYFTIDSESEEDGMLLTSSVTVGKIEKKQRMFMRIKDGANFSPLRAYLCDFSDEKVYAEMLKLANRINAEYLGVRAYVMENGEDEDDKFCFVMAVENFFGEEDLDMRSLFTLDRLLTNAVDKEFDNVMKIVFMYA